jgi:hypothetical protein
VRTSWEVDCGSYRYRASYLRTAAAVCGNVIVGICRADTRVDSGRGIQNNFEQIGSGNYSIAKDSFVYKLFNTDKKWNSGVPLSSRPYRRPIASSEPSHRGIKQRQLWHAQSREKTKSANHRVSVSRSFVAFYYSVRVDSSTATPFQAFEETTTL